MDKVALEAEELYAELKLDISGAEEALSKIEAHIRRLAGADIPALFEAIGAGAMQALAGQINADAGEAVSSALMEGLTRGISGSRAALDSAVRDAAEAGAMAAAMALSPDRGLQIGRDFGLGIADGITQMRDAVSQAAAMLRSAMDEVRAGFEAGMRSAAAYRPYAAARTEQENTLSSYARAMAAALSNVTVQMDGQRVGDLVTSAVSRNIAGLSALRG